MWLFWTCFVIFLSQPAAIRRWWPLPTIDHGGWMESGAARLGFDVALIALFGLQHSVMARPRFKTWLAQWIGEPFERCLFVHMANVALFAMILLWQPLPAEIWSLPRGGARDLCWVVFAIGWLILFAGAWSFGILELLGVRQMHRWLSGVQGTPDRLQTGYLYRWLRHPMYVGVLVGVWVTPDMTAGHLLLAAGLTIYILIGKRYEERDLARRFGDDYVRWRSAKMS
jgi:methanethiol S-methyltransferase